MINRRTLLAASLAMLAGSLATAVAQQQHLPAASDSASPQKPAQVTTVATAENAPVPTMHDTSPPANSHDSSIREARALRLEGEKRFRANCGRCHVAPLKFPPRAMATILRHMRVRALITDEDRRLILRYMTE